MKSMLLPIAAALLSVAGPAIAGPSGQSATAQAEQVRIPFASFGTIRNFRAVGDDVVYLQGTHRRWYRAELNGPCLNLPAALRIGLDTRFSGNTLDNTSTLIVGGEHCRIMSLTRAESPPPRRARR